jgi:hypothetical protein
VNIPGIKEILAVVNNMPDQFDALVQRLDRVVELLEETNELLRTEARHG